MKYSDWQLNRIRDALRACHQYERLEDGRYYSWGILREAIAVETDVEIGTGRTPELAAKHGAERLRQFVEGATVKGVRRWFDLKDEWTDAVVAFLMADEIGLLSNDDLEEYRPDYQAGLRLIEHLWNGCPTQGGISVKDLQGTLRSTQDLAGELENLHIVRDMALSDISDKGVFQVEEVEYVYDASDMAEGLPPEAKLKNRELNTKRYYGWAVLAPEDQLMVFMKNPVNGRNHYYIMLASSFVSLKNPPGINMALLRHETSLELDKFDSKFLLRDSAFRAKICDYFLDNAHLFSKQEKHPVDVDRQAQ